MSEHESLVKTEWMGSCRQIFVENMIIINRRLDELAGESLRLDYQISGLRKEVTQKRQAFTLLSRLQQTVGSEKDPSSIFGLVLQEVNGTLWDGQDHRSHADC